MRILYCALAVALDGAHGGATHVAEVTNGLHALGHDLWVIGRGNPAQPPRHLHASVTVMQPPPMLGWAMMPTVQRAIRRFKPDVVMERFYTFAGDGILAAHYKGLPTLLEVNAPVMDPPGSRKDWLDRLTGRPMARWASQQCVWADAIVTPLATTVPEAARERVVRLDWGANVDQFDPARHPKDSAAARHLRARLGIPADAPVIGFHGSFRAWHGAADAIRAFAEVRQTLPAAHLLLIGDGPERNALEAQVRGSVDAGHVVFTGSVPYAAMPGYVALYDVAVAPFAPRLHTPLRHFGFYWSPLKVWEAMAMGVPVVTTAVPPLTEIVAGCGAAVPEGNSRALAAALGSFLLLPAPQRATMAARARARIMARYSWQAHCGSLDATLEALVTGERARR